MIILHQFPKLIESNSSSNTTSSAPIIQADEPDVTEINTVWIGVEE